MTTYIDNKAPTVTINSPSEEDILNVTQITVNVTVTDDNALDRVKLYVDGIPHNETTLSGKEWTGYLNTTNDLDEGTYMITVTAYDKTGNSNSTQVNVTVDNTPPTKPVLSYTTKPGAVNLSWTTASDNYVLDHYVIYVSDSSGIDVTDSSTYNWSVVVNETTYEHTNGTPGVTYYYVVAAYDKVGNYNVSNEINVTYPSREPSDIIITAPSTVTVNQTVQITVRVIDEYGENVSGVDVSFGVTAGNVNPAISTTSDDGTATTNFTAPQTAGTVTLSVFVLGKDVSNSTTIEIVPEQTPADARVYADPSTAPADGVSKVKIIVEILDQYGNVIPTASGYVVYLSTTAGTLEDTSGIVENGTFVTNLTASTTPTTATVTANIAGIGTRTTTVEFVAAAEFTIELVRGWQMVSAPLKSPITCDKQLIMYEYNALSGMYERATTFEPGKGYWVASATEQTITLRGSGMLENVTIELKKGWNLIGSIQHEVNLDSIENPDVYEYAYTWDTANKCYIVTQTIQPGKAYWIFAFNDTTITLEPLPPSPPE